MRSWKVGIVGGGPGGLMTAYALQKLANSPIQLTLFEAGPRLGGKILTPRFSSQPVRYEAGAAEFYDYSLFGDDPLKELIAELGLPIHPMGGPVVVLNQCLLSNLDDIREQLGVDTYHAIREFDRLAKDRMTPQEFFYSDDSKLKDRPAERGQFAVLLQSIANPQARHYLESLIHSDLATEPGKTSLEYGLQNYLMNDPAYLQLYGIEGGNERLPQELAARLSGDILLEQRVSSVCRQGSQLRIRSWHGERMREDDFDFLIIALPHSHLASVEYQGERLAAALQRHHAHYDHPAHYLRITLLFDQPFWRSTVSDSYWMLDQFGGCCLYDESSREPEAQHGVLGWLLGGETALQKSRTSDDELIAEVLASLPAFLAHGRQHFVEGRVHRWVGAVNAIPGGLVPQSLDRRHQPEPVEHPNLFVVGDYLFDSTLNGVLDSAEYVAAWVAAQIEDNLGVTNDHRSRKESRERPHTIRHEQHFETAARLDGTTNSVCLAANP